MTLLRCCLKSRGFLKNNKHNPRILVLGESGRLGSKILDSLLSHKTLAKTFSSNNMTKHEKFRYSPLALHLLLIKSKPNIVINCIAATRPNSNFLSSLLVNTILPLHLALFSCFKRIWVIHFSTNAVFSGNSDYYDESSLPTPRTIYGLTKALGDLSFFGCLIIRTSFVGFTNKGNVHNGVVGSILDSNLNANLLISRNFRWNGITSDLLAKMVTGIILEDIKFRGIVHISSATVTTRLELVELLKIRLNRSDLIIESDSLVTPLNFALFTRKTELVSRIWKSSGYAEPTTIAELINEMKIC